MFCQKPHYNNLKLYKKLQKAKASLVTQFPGGTKTSKTRLERKEE